jgi:uncharacterized membrane protein
MHLVTASIVSVVAATAAVAQPSLTLIEPMAGYPNTGATGVSADGNSVSGYSDSLSAPVKGFHWTRAGGRTEIVIPAGTPPSVNTGAISGDGNVVAGMVFSPSSFYRWTPSGGYQGLGAFPGWTGGQVHAMNGDGSSFVGHVQVGSPPDAQAFRWTAQSGLQLLGYLRPNSWFSQATDISRDGQVIVGFSAPSLFGPLEAFRWTQATGMQPLTVPGDLFDETRATALSADGGVTFGIGFNGLQANPWRWTAAGMVDLGMPSGARSATLETTNLDGSVAAGFVTFGANDVAYLWTVDAGYIPFTDYLAQFGVFFPSDYDRLEITDMSDDGLTFVGRATDQQGIVSNRAFVVTVPAPSTTLVLVCTLLGVRRRRRAGL